MGAAPAALRPRHIAPVRCQFMQLRDEMHARGAINSGVVRLSQHRKAVLDDARNLHAFDQVELPERTRKIERAGEDAGTDFHERRPVAGAGQGNPTHVVLEIEFTILNPIGIVQVKGHADQALAGERPKVQPLFEIAEHIRLRQSGNGLAVGSRRLFVDIDGADVHRRRLGFHESEGSVLSRELGQHGDRFVIV